MRYYHNISAAWFFSCNRCLNSGYTYTIDRGSYVGQQRKQLEWLAGFITNPSDRPLGITYNNIPVSDDESIYRYFEDYLVNTDTAENEQYTYGNRVAPWLETVAAMLQDTPQTNQATIEVGRPEDILLPDPPCLRVLSWKVTPSGLQLTSFWRSWDLFTGFPTNMGGLQLLNEMMAEWVGVRPGRLVYYSDGAHIYDHCWEMF